MKYRKGYKYQLAEDESIQTTIYGYNIITEFIVLTPGGLLTIKRGYAWDGCSGPTYDDDTNMTAGLIHDALYQLLRMGFIPDEYRETADRMLRDICIKNGMWKIRAWYYLEGVDHFAMKAAKEGYDPYPIQEAP